MSELDTVWGVAEIGPDGFVNPSAVMYASSREAAIHKAERLGKTAVMRHVTEWTAVVVADPADTTR
jgi:hypothetical protein